MSTDHKVGLLIPMFRSAATIGNVLQSIATTIITHNLTVLILDNHSDDGSCDVARESIESLNLVEHVSIRRHETNLGYGGSIAWGLKWARDKLLLRVAIIHSDDQTEWNVVLEGLLSEDEGSNVVVFASRFGHGANLDAYDWRRRIGNGIFLNLTPLLTGVRIDDPGTAICSLPVSQIPYDVLHQLDIGYHFHPQLNLILAAGPNGVVRSFPMKWYDASRDNELPLFRYGLKLVTILLRIGFSKRILRRDIKHAVTGLTVD